MLVAVCLSCVGQPCRCHLSTQPHAANAYCAGWWCGATGTTDGACGRRQWAALLQTPSAQVAVAVACVRTVCNVLALCIWVGGGKEQQLPWAVLLVCVSTHPVQSLGSGGLSFPFLNPVLSCTRNRKASRAAPGSVVGVYAGAARASAAPMLCRLQPPGPGCCAHACTWASA
jgi:hypothetical protein